MTMKDRVEKAVELFKSGYNCSQSVVAAFADMYGFTQEQALRMSASFGGGIGRMRQTCGAACGMFLLAGLEKGAVDGKDREAKPPTMRWCSSLRRNSGTQRLDDLRRTVGTEEARRLFHPRSPHGAVLRQASLRQNGGRGGGNMGGVSGKTAEIGQIVPFLRLNGKES